MFRKMLLSSTRSIIFATLLWSVCLIPVSSNSRNIKCITGTIFPSKSSDHLRRNNPLIGGFTQTKELSSRDLFNQNESAVATLLRLANIRLLNLAARQQEQRRISIASEKSSPLMISERKYGVGGTGAIGKITSVEVPEKLEFKPRKFHCHPIEDIFIPAIDKMVPAYICKHEFRQFIISSERFLEDFKNHLDVTVDETTFHRLSIPDETGTGNSVANVIPVTLTQRQGDEFYGVKRTKK